MGSQGLAQTPVESHDGLFEREVTRSRLVKFIDLLSQYTERLIISPCITLLSYY